MNALKWLKGTVKAFEKNNIQIGNIQNSKNTIYNIDSYVCTGRNEK